MSIRRADAPANPPRTNALAEREENQEAPESPEPKSTVAEPPPPPPRSVDVASRNRVRAAALANEARVQTQVQGEEITGNKELDQLLNQLPPDLLSIVKNLAQALRKLADAIEKQAGAKPQDTGTNSKPRGDVRTPQATAPPANNATAPSDVEQLLEPSQDDADRRNANGANGANNVRRGLATNPKATNLAETPDTGANANATLATNVNATNLATDANALANVNVNVANANRNANANANAANLATDADATNLANANVANANRNANANANANATNLATDADATNLANANVANANRNAKPNANATNLATDADATNLANANVANANRNANANANATNANVANRVANDANADVANIANANADANVANANANIANRVANDVANNANANANANVANANANANANVASANRSTTVTDTTAATPYTVKKGDTMSAIARRNSVSLKNLIDANPQTRANPNRIRVGQTLNIPNAKKAAPTEPSPRPTTTVPTPTPRTTTTAPAPTPRTTTTAPTPRPTPRVTTPTPHPTTTTAPTPTTRPTTRPATTLDPKPTTTTTLDPKPTRTTTPDPKPTATITPNPKPTTTTTPDPKPTTTTTPNPKPTTTTTPDPKPTATITPDPKPTATITPAPKPTATTAPAPKPTTTTTPAPKPTTTRPAPKPTTTTTPNPKPVVAPPLPPRKPAPPPVMERRFETQGTFTDKDAARTNLANRTFAQLKTAGLLPADTKLDTKLPADVQKRVDRDAAFDGTKPKTYGDLMKSLVGDGDKDGKLDFDTLQLNEVLPKATQQGILKAVTADTAPADIEKTLKASGADATAAAAAANDKKLKLDAPEGFGLKGENKIDEVQQQTLLRTGVIFADSNKNGKLDPTDKVSFLDKDGSVRESTFGALSPQLQKTVKLNAATAEAARTYNDRPVDWMRNPDGSIATDADGNKMITNRVKFPHYNRKTGENEKEAVNTDFWTIDSANVRGRNQTSWKLNDGKTPAEAVDDVLSGADSPKYTTECAQMRDVMRLKGLRDYYTNEYGKDEGSFRFNAEFPKDAGEQKKAQGYLTRLDAFKKANPGKGWDDFQKQEAAPAVKYAMQISRHDVLSGTGSVIAPWQTSYNAGESAAGDAGYFHNYGVSVEGVRIGYGGENVLDVGFAKNPKTGEIERQFWGHPGGIKGEKAWQEELGTDAIMAKSGTDFQEYFSAEDVQRKIGQVVDKQTKRIDDLIAKKPTADQREKLEIDRAFLQSSGDALSAVTSHIDDSKLDAAKALLKDGKADKPSDMKPLANSLDADGKKLAVAAFGKLPAQAQDALAKMIGKDKAKLSDDEKAQAALYATMTDGGHLTPSSESLLATSVVNTGAASYLKAANAKTAAPAGPLHSRDDFNKWLGTPAFAKWYEQKTGQKWTGGKSVDDLSHDEVQKIVELALPQTKNMRTAYVRLNGGTPQYVSSQLATLLKDGKLAAAEYSSEGTSIPL